MTPSFRGRMATMLPGVRPIIFLASRPTARMPPVFWLIATTDGSLSTIPRPRTYTRVLAVPRSTAMSRPMNDMLFAMGKAPSKGLRAAGSGQGAIRNYGPRPGGSAHATYRAGRSEGREEQADLTRGRLG